MTATAVGPIEDALLVLLKADGTLSTIEGTPQLGEPANPAERAVWIVPEITSDQIADLSGGTERVEHFELSIACFAAMSGSDYVAARDRSAALADAVSAVIMANFHLTFAVGIVDLHMTGLVREYGAWDKRQGYWHTVKVTAQSVLT